MVAWVPPAEVRTAFALPDGEPPEKLHLTIANLGKASELDEATVNRARSIVQRLAAVQPPLAGVVGGTGLFTTDEGPNAVVALIDAPDLPNLYTALCEGLEASSVPVKHEHGFTPHVTIAYSDDDTLRAAPMDVVIDSLSLVVADAETRFPLA